MKVKATTRNVTILLDDVAYHVVVDGRAVDVPECSYVDHLIDSGELVQVQ